MTNSQARLKECVDYESETGVFTWVILRVGVRIGARAGSQTKRGYRYLMIDYKPIAEHRAAWLFVHGWLPKMIDHINGDKTDNRLANLRPATPRINSENRRVAYRTGASGYLGVSKQNKKWRAGIKVAGKSIVIGHFNTPQEAHSAYVEAKRVLHAGCTI